MAQLDHPKSSADPDRLAPLRTAVKAFTALADAKASEAQFLSEGRRILSKLIAQDTWLEEDFRKTHPDFYQQYLLYCDPHERFSIQSFVWGPGQSTPVHDHTVWGLVGVFQGAERCERFRQTPNGFESDGGPVLLERGQVDAVSPIIGDIHKVSNAFDDQTSISIHVYGANIGSTPRHVFDVGSGVTKDFVSGYSSSRLPNIWDQTASVRARLAKGAR
jgi:predicted metal-dependent enzyme (double-stranded beta helix superfamily)